MLRTTLTAMAACLVMTSASFAGPEDKVASIEVSIDLSAVTNAEAAKRYTYIADDLKNAIAAVLVDRILPKGEEGLRLTIDINEVELSNSYSEAAGSADTHLEASVNVADRTNNANAKGFCLIVDINEALPILPPDSNIKILKADSDKFYRALVKAFAVHVVQEMDK